jgi:hypothetical protein
MAISTAAAIDSLMWHPAGKGKWSSDGANHIKSSQVLRAFMQRDKISLLLASKMSVCPFPMGRRKAILPTSL